MRKIYLLLACMSLWCNPAYASSAVSSPETIQHQHALAWKKTFLSLWQAQKYQQLKFIDQMGVKHFAQDPMWQDPAFIKTWQAWLRVRAKQGWSVGDGNVGMWRLAEGQDALRPSMGFKREYDGSWWVVFVQPQEVKQQRHAGWECRGRCKISISNGQTKRILDMRPPQSEEWNRVYTLGAPIPYTLLKPQANVWSVDFPNGDSFDFDVSYAFSICQDLLGTCWVDPATTPPVLVPAPPLSPTPTTISSPSPSAP